MHRNFKHVMTAVEQLFRLAPVVRTNTWQGVNISAKPEMATREVEDVILGFPITSEDLQHHREMIEPNLPWADNHFEQDRVSGEPLNPGNTWQSWPWGNSASNFRDDNGQFNHSYAERYWPKWAGQSDRGEIYFRNENERGPLFAWANHHTQNEGIRYRYGDLKDLIDLLVRDPSTRAAYLPVWFPEDTGIVHMGRVPCTIGYLFRMRNNKLSVFYQIRSCDFTRHFRDDVYLTVRLLLWILDECRKLDPNWAKVTPGNFTMHVGSFHMFVNDWNKMYAL